MRKLLTFASLLFAIPCWAGPGIAEILPWIGNNQAALGMTRDEFTKIRPAAVHLDLSDSPPPANRPFSGTYLEGDVMKPQVECCMYTFTKGELRTVWWGRKNESTEADTREIRRQLIAAYGKPKLGSLARMNANGQIEKITRELYLTAEKNGYAVYLAATRESGIEVAVISVSDPNYPFPDFEKSLSTVLTSGVTRNEDKPTLIDILAKVVAEE